MFKFKQFTINQTDCAMKVTTDGCLFGALVANELQTEKNILDIGSGTGLLSLMLAQKTMAIIDAVEIDEKTYQQSLANFAASPFKEQLNAMHIDIKEIDSSKQYDCIISNPPFFHNDLLSADDKKNAAKHDTTLTLEALIKIVVSLLDTKGKFAVLLPYHRVDEFITSAARYGLFLFKKVLVQQTPTHKFFRGILFFKKGNSEVKDITMMIKDEQGNYTPAFIELLKDYYLYL